MTWADFKAAVIEELGVDGQRRGIEKQRVRWMRDAVIDLQRYIRAYRAGHTTRYDVADLTETGYAHLGTLPAQAKPKAFYIISLVPKSNGDLPDPNTARNRLDFIAWENRQIMISDRRGVRHYQYSISPFSRQFLVHPLVNDETYLLIVWDGLKSDFDDLDEVPFPEQAAEAVGIYVKYRILREVDKRLDVAKDLMDPTVLGSYPKLRLALSREQRESQNTDGKDEEYDATSVPSPASIVGFGAQNIPFLATVTQVAGTDNTALAAVPTLNLTPPFAVEFANGTTLITETWVLKASTDASDGVSVQRPNDYNGTTNAKVWFKLSA